MSRFAIRDDDTSFFTHPKDLDAVYAPYWGKVPISLAVVPFSVPVHKEMVLSSDRSPDEKVPLGENAALVEFLRAKVAKEEVEIMLHGSTHEYRKIGGRWVGEFAWKPGDQLKEETAKGKAYLEHLLSCTIRTFVPPGNSIGRAGVSVLRAEGLHLSGIMGKGGDRPLTWDYFPAYLKRWSYRVLKGRPYPFPLYFGEGMELCAHTLTPRTAGVAFLKDLETTLGASAPFVLATHYWEFKGHPEMGETLGKAVEKARQAGCHFTTVSDCFEKE